MIAHVGFVVKSFVEIFRSTIMDKSVDTFEQNKRFPSASFRNFEKHLFLLIANPPSPPFQCCNTLRGHFHLVTTLKWGEGAEMSKLDIDNSLVERNGSFSESVSTTFVYDCLNYILHILKLSQYHHCSVYSEMNE